MIDLLYASLLNLLEMTFIFITLLLTLHQRKAIGIAPFYMVMGLVLVFSHLLNAAGVNGTLYGDMTYNIGENIFYLPVLAAYLCAYISLGTLATQHMIIGMIVLFGSFLYLSEITGMQCNWLGFSISTGLSGATLDELLDSARRSVNYSIPMRMADLFIVPIVFSKLRQYKLKFFFCFLGSLACTQLLAYFAFELFGGTPSPGDQIMRFSAAIWLTFLSTVYFSKIETEISGKADSPLDIIFAFFAGYRRSKELEKNVRTWENRYRNTFENVSEMIVILNHSGIIQDCNKAARDRFGKNKTVIGQRLSQQIQVIEPEEFSLETLPDHPMRFRAKLNPGTGEERIINSSISPTELNGENVLLLIGTDITEEIKLAEEKNALTEQLFHTQRLESLGMLAGGIAHDFNNNIHSILGHADMGMFMNSGSPEIASRFERISKIAEQAGHLTSQLLGFARKGKYRVSDLDVKRLVGDSISMLAPHTIDKVEIEQQISPGSWIIRADEVQMRQVLINAVDATAEKRFRKILIRVGKAEESGLAFQPPQELNQSCPGDFMFIAVEDNGCGMTPEIKSKVFDPFFTTKPVGVGTGMGLAMVYGTIHNHQGWVQLESEPENGTCFCLYLPLVSNPEKETSC